MSNTNHQSHEIRTLLRLVAPDTVEVELVPLASVEKAEFLFFWSTIFLTVWGTVLGTWLSLVTVSYENRPVLNLTLGALIFLSLLVVSFTSAGFKARSSARKTARSSPVVPQRLPMPDRMDNVNRKFIEFLPKEFTEKEFKDLVNSFDNNDNDDALQALLFDRAIATKAIVQVDGDSVPVKFRKYELKALAASAKDG